LPSEPQVVPEAAHALCATWPATTGRQRPAAPPVKVPPEQALQPVHALSQHTASATMLDTHSKGCVAGVPLTPLVEHFPVEALQ
jgi:hypothetical protein